MSETPAPASAEEPIGGDGSVRLVETSLGQTILLERPTRRNALTLRMWHELGVLANEVGSVGDEPLFVTGADGYFCSGADLDALRWARSDAAHAVQFVHTVVGALLSLHVAQREVVAVVEGGAAGGGVEIMAACDRRIALGEPTLVFPFGHHGMELDGFTRWRLHQLVGDEEAERLVDGRHVVALPEARRLGLFDEQHDSMVALSIAEHQRPAAATPREPGPSYVDGTQSLPEAVHQAAGPMLKAFPPHR